MKKYFYPLVFVIAVLIASAIFLHATNKRAAFPNLFHDIYVNHPVVSIEDQQDTIVYVGSTPLIVHYLATLTEDIQLQPQLTPSGHWLYQMTFADDFIAEGTQVLNIKTSSEDIVLQIYVNCISYQGRYYSIPVETFEDDLNTLFEQDIQQCGNTSMMARLPSKR